MSWLNFNESLNNIKGQLSSFANGVLADDVVNDGNSFTELAAANHKIQELQNLCASKDVEIASLRRTTAEFYEKLSNNTKVKNDCNETNGGNNEDHWFWDPPSTDNTAKDKTLQANNTNTTISDLNKKIQELEIEKKDLVQSLEQLDIDCQRTTDKLVTLKDNLQADYNDLKKEYDSVMKENLELTQENSKIRSNLNTNTDEMKTLKDSNLKLQTQIDNLKESSTSNNHSKQFEALHKEITSLKTRCDDLMKERDNLEESTKQRDEALKTEYEGLYRKLKNDTVSLEKYNQLLKDYKNCQIKLAELDETNNCLQEKMNSLKNEIDKLKKPCQQNNLSDDYKKLQDMYDELKKSHTIIEGERDELHKKYVEILTETVKKYVDYEIPNEFVYKPEENSYIAEFTCKVEVVLKLLLDFKWKTETLEKKLCEISHEKSVAIAEKNHEIEKLLHNSEILSQEVITKTRTIKDYESECSELIKNNDLLIAELQQYKNNNALQTISETNEDNLLLLETQLENANKRIRELELVISDMENTKQDAVLETQTELDYIKKQLNMTGKELSQSKKEYHDLLQLFQQYELENQNLQKELSELKSWSNDCLAEKNNLESTLDKLKTDFENTDYKWSEASVELMSANEELEKLKVDYAEICNSHENLKQSYSNSENKNNAVQNELSALKTHVDELVHIRTEMETQIKYLNEKLQNSKMTETGLKLQNDTMKKELETLIEIKTNMEEKCQALEKEKSLINETLNELILDSELLKDIQNANGLSVIQKIDTVRNQLKVAAFNFQNQQKDSETEDKLVNVSNDYSNLKVQYDELMNSKQNLETELVQTVNSMRALEKQIDDYESEIHSYQSKNNQIENQIKEQILLKNEINSLNLALQQSNLIHAELQTKISQLESEINNLNISKTELVNLVTVKHQENINYHTEIQRLNQIITSETEKCKEYELKIADMNVEDKSAILEQNNIEIDKLTDQNNFLKEKCEKLTMNLLEEQSKVQKILAERQNMFDKEQTLSKELERLRLHLYEIENSYTQELLQAEQKNQEMLSKVSEIEQRERDSSTIYTSVSIRANQQVETLQNQLQLVTAQRDELQKKISDAEDKNNKQFAALTNLQCVLEQFQKDKDRDIFNETNRIRRQINVEKQKQDELQTEINTLKAQLEESKQGLKAAARLTEQVEKSKQQVTAMKDEVAKYQDQLTKTEEKYSKLISQTDTKVDKLLVKNLIVGLISSNYNLNKDQSQILKIIATVLDFNQQDIEKVKLNRPNTGSWLSSILHPQALNSNPDISQQSLSEAFVRFLESESQPKTVPPTLLNIPESSHAGSSKYQHARKNSHSLNEVVLPTFADFAQNRNSSSILKDVLKENN